MALRPFDGNLVVAETRFADRIETLLVVTRFRDAPGHCSVDTAVTLPATRARPMMW